MPGAGHPFGYFSQDQIEELDNEDIKRVVTEHDPTQEFVVVLLKRDDHVSTYRVGIVPPESPGAGRVRAHLAVTESQRQNRISSRPTWRH